jgi:Skp family chaperone for outer membrane proteins
MSDEGEGKKTGKRIMQAINLVLLIAIIVGAYIGWGKLQANNAKIGEINRLQRVFGEQKWQEAADGFEALFERYPETKATYGDQLGQCYQFLADDMYQPALRLKLEERKQAMAEVAAMLEKAREYGSLTEAALFTLCDCYGDLQEYDKVLAVIAEAERREDVNGARFFIQKNFAERQMKK